MVEEDKINETPSEETPVVPAEEQSAITAEEPVTPEEAPPAKHKYADRLASAYPDKKFDTDEDHDKGMDEYLKDLEGYKEKGKAASKKLVSLFESEPQVGEIVRDMLNGATFREALARHISPEDLVAIEGDPDYEGWTKNKTAREEGAAKQNKFKEEYSANISLSEQAVTAFVESKGMSEEDADAFFQKFDDMIADIHNGKITPEHLEAISKALNYDTDILSATDQGRIAGRNENIVAGKEAVSTKGDGLPAPSRSSDTEDAPVKPNYMDEMVRKTKNRDVFA